MIQSKQSGLYLPREYVINETVYPPSAWHLVTASALRKSAWVEDKGVPKGEVHLRQGGRVVAKLTNVA